MKSSISYTARSGRWRAAFLAAAVAWAACAAGGEDRHFSCKDEPWSGDDVRFVNDMLLTWRPDYRKLSVGEFRVYVRDVLLGLQPPGERYEIDTDKKGSILFEKKDGDIRCTIEQP